jgi:SDR family mycofactocin-dependent oxidoreductase
MAERVKDKVALVTGAGRGQGRAHAVRLAEEGADVILLDICATPAWAAIPLSSPEDLAETAALVEKLGQRALSVEVDVADAVAMKRAVAGAVQEAGRLDVVVANAGVCVLGEEHPDEVYMETVAINFGGVFNTFHAALPHVGAGASLIAIGSYAGMRPQGVANGPGGMGYSFAKRSVAQLVNSMALLLGPRSIRVNAVHPTNVNTDLLMYDGMYRVFRPDLDAPTFDDARDAFTSHQLMPVPFVEARDVADTVLFLASDESRYVTGMQMRVDAGALVKAGVSGL